MKTEPADTDAKMADAPDANGDVEPGISVRFGPVQDNESNKADTENDVNGGGANKRKTRGSVGQRKSYAEPESSGEDEPLVCFAPPCSYRSLFNELTCSTEQASSQVRQT